MTLAPTYLANAILVISVLLQFLNIDIAPEALQTTVTTILLVVVPLFTMVRQLFTGRSTLAGTKPK